MIQLLQNFSSFFLVLFKDYLPIRSKPILSLKPVKNFLSIAGKVLPKTIERSYQERITLNNNTLIKVVTELNFFLTGAYNSRTLHVHMHAGGRERMRRCHSLYQVPNGQSWCLCNQNGEKECSTASFLIRPKMAITRLSLSANKQQVLTSWLAEHMRQDSLLWEASARSKMVAISYSWALMKPRWGRGWGRGRGHPQMGEGQILGAPPEYVSPLARI